MLAAKAAASATETTTATPGAPTVDEDSAKTASPEGEERKVILRNILLDEMVQAHAQLSANADAMKMELEDLNEERFARCFVLLHI